MHDVLVVGAGIVGLTSAVRLQEAGAKVAVMTADEPAQTVSAIAAAVWYPTHMPGDPRVLGWGRRTFEELLVQAMHGVPGVVMRPTRMLLRRSSPQPPWWAGALRDFRSAGPADVRAPFAGEWQFTVPTVEMKRYLDWLIQRITSGGGVLLRRRIDRFEDVATLAPVVVNATGLAARRLAHDPGMHPVRGHLVLVANPGLSVSVRDEDNPAGLTYIHPRSQDVVLGGTFEPGAWDCTPSASIQQQILERCAALVPELRGAQAMHQLVGLRPARHGSVRLCVDPAGLPGGVRLIHNYGHGGAGVTLGWGCADDVVRLAGRNRNERNLGDSHADPRNRDRRSRSDRPDVGRKNDPSTPRGLESAGALRVGAPLGGRQSGRSAASLYTSRGARSEPFRGME